MLPTKYNALDVAGEIITTATRIKAPVSNLKLQKILYYVQAKHLVETGDTLFTDDILAWRFGPVVYAAFREYRGYVTGDVLVPSFPEYLKSVDSKVSGQYITPIVEKYKDISAWDLAMQTHEETPWIDAYKENDAKHSVIPVESIKEYFSDHREKIS